MLSGCSLHSQMLAFKVRLVDFVMMGVRPKLALSEMDLSQVQTRARSALNSCSVFPNTREWILQALTEDSL